MAEEEKEKKKRLRDFFEKNLFRENKQAVLEDDFENRDKDELAKADKKTKRRGLGWLVALGVLAAAAVFSLPAIFILITKFAVLPTIGLLIGAGVVGLDLGFLASIGLSRKRRKEYKALRAFKKDLTSEKSKQLVARDKKLARRFVEENSKDMSASDVATKKAEVDKKLSFGEWFKYSEGNGVDKDKLDAAVKKYNDPKTRTTLTSEEKEMLLKSLSVDEGKIESNMKKAYIKFDDPYVCKKLTYKDKSGTEKEISLGDKKLDSYQGLRALEIGYGILCSEFGCKDVQFQYVSKGERQPNKYTELKNTDNKKEALARSMDR